jgi:hypothetical protein
LKIQTMFGKILNKTTEGYETTKRLPGKKRY